MDDGEQDSAPTALPGDPRVIIATTLAAFFFAGSAYMWRSLPKSVFPSSHQRGESTSKDPDSAAKVELPSLGSDVPKAEGASSVAQGTGATGTAVNGDGESSSFSVDAKDSKSVRSKERRKRGKDPLKELLKNEKKSKSFLKPTKPTIDLSDTPESPPPVPKSFREQTGNAREPTHDSSGRSRSLSRASLDRRLHPSAHVESDASDRPRSQDTTEHEDDPFLNTTPVASKALSVGTGTNSQDAPPITTPSDSTSTVASSSQESTATTRPSDYPTISLSASSSTSNSGSVLSSTSNLTPNTSPTLSPPWKDVSPLPKSHPQPSTSTLPTKNIPESLSLPAVSGSGPSASWDWDGAGPSNIHDQLPSRKPPRFRSKSRGGSGSITMSPSIPESAMLTRFSESSDSASGPSTSSQSIDQIPEDGVIPFTFPSLNASSGTAPMSPTSNRPPGTPSGPVPRRAPTPGRRPPTPRSSTSTPPPSLSAQTQLASLRGALEAARIREEKNKTDLEKVTKELEVARYEWAATRSRELDLQNQINHLAHQVQMYAAMAGGPKPPNPPAPSTGTPGHTPNPSISQPASSEAPASSTQPNGFQPPPPPPAPSTNPQTPSHLVMSPQMQMYLPSGLLSPLAMNHPSPRTPFHPYPYSPMPAMSGMPSPYHYASPSPMFPSFYSNPKGSESTGGRSASGSGPSSTAGSSSAGSHSPDLNAAARMMPSSTPPPGSSTSLNRGRGRIRRNGSGEAEGENGSGSDGHSSVDDALATFTGKLSRRSPYPSDEDQDDDDSDLNNVLADAILKRPGSIRGLSKRKKSDRDMSGENVEFTFPSLSNFGNVNPSGSDVALHEEPAEIVGDEGPKEQPHSIPEPQDDTKTGATAVDVPQAEAEAPSPPTSVSVESSSSETPQEAH